MSTTPDPSRSENICPTCGTPLPENLPAEQCPKCLLAAGLTTERTGEAVTVTDPAKATRHELPRPGDHFGHYQIARLLGQGGMGAVFEAEDLESGRRVALKVLGQRLDSPEARQRFLREGRLAASINHPNSVYVYGTEEIGGTPVIAMELVAGGTLQEHVASHGPLPVAAAVDAVLQVIAGLEAAQALGILHRDIKPSNCFEDVDGTVKIGDFGLSVSTVRTDANVTVQGMLLGTPSFASPEQLRGQELNARSDIYSVGVTLYYLLTGRTPFEGRSVVQLIANVLEQPAPSPAHFRPEIPQGLARVVLRCLEKQPGERFRNYADLRQALGPFSSTAPVPAPPALRFMAGAIDMVVVGLAGLSASFLLFGEPLPFAGMGPLRTGKMVSLVISAFVLVVTYYSVLEGRWGASVGKALCRLRVTGPSRNPPGILKALARTLIFQIPPVLPYWLSIGFDPIQMLSNSSGLMQYAISSLYYLVVAVLFCTARRKNGYAGLHDLLTGTRVIRRVPYQARLTLPIRPEPAPALLDQASVGPYHVIEPLESTREWLVGYDTRLLRKVWIHQLPAGALPLSPALRQIGRPGRLRWIAGRRSASENWDAFENVSGTPLLLLASERQPWDQVRFWLHDLAKELQMAEKDGSVPVVLTPERVWITAEGRAKLLDFPAPGLGTLASSTEAPSAAAPGIENAQPFSDAPPVVGASPAAARFLSDVARAALEGNPQLAPARQPALAVPLPLSARQFLSRLPELPGAAAIMASLEPLLQQMAHVSRLRRLGLVAACAALPLMAGTGLVFSSYALQRWERQQPGVWMLSQVLSAQASRNLPWANRALPDERTLAIYIASQYRPLITNSNQWRSLYAISMIKGTGRKFAERSVANFPNPSEQEVDAATAAVEPVLSSFPPANSLSTHPWFPVLAVGFSLIIYVALPALFAALLFRGGLILRALRVAVVRSDGTPASRWRVCWRGLVGWAPVLLWPLGLVCLMPAVGVNWAAVLLMAVVGSIVLCSILLPNRTLQDRLAGTFLVPR